MNTFGAARRMRSSQSAPIASSVVTIVTSISDMRRLRRAAVIAGADVQSLRQAACETAGGADNEDGPATGDPLRRRVDRLRTQIVGAAYRAVVVSNLFL